MKRIIYAALLVIFLTGKAEAVIPPLDNEDRIAMSSHVIEGTVENIAMITEDDRLGTRRIYTLTVKVGAVLKGESITPEGIIDIRYWHAGQRPKHWVGDTGQRGNFSMGATYRFFLDNADDGFHLLSPNGSESINTPFSYLIYTGDNFTLFYPEGWESEWMQRNETVRFTPKVTDQMPPVASNVTVNRLPQGCEAVAVWGGHISNEISTFIDAKIDKPIITDGGKTLEIGYSWKDEPHQSDIFRNLDRVFCRGNEAYLIRYYSTQKEYDNYLDVARLLNRSFTHKPTQPQD